MSEDGRCWCVDRKAADGAVFDATKESYQAFKVHCFLKRIPHDFVDERVIRDLDVPDNGLEARRSLRKNTGHEVIGARALDLRGYALAFGHPQELEAAGGGPPPAVLENRRCDGGLFEELFGGVFGEEVEDVGERKAVLLSEGDVDTIVGGSGLQLEVEAAAEAFSESQTEGFVDRGHRRVRAE